MDYNTKFLSYARLKSNLRNCKPSPFFILRVMASYDSDSEESSVSDISLGEFADEFVQDYLNVFGDDSEEEEENEFEGFRFEMPEEMEWTPRGQPTQSADPDRRPDVRSGPQIDLDANWKAIDFFQLYFTDELLKKIVDWTEANAEKHFSKSRDADEEERPKWSMTLAELKAYFAILIIANNLLMVPRNERFFIADDGKWLFHINTNKVFTRNRFREIQRFVHFVDPNVPRPLAGEPGHDRLFVIKPVLDHLQEKFMSLYMMDKNIAIDESMIPFKGHLSWIQRMPQKPVKVGIKVFVVAESSTGYCWNFQVYVGKVREQHDDFGDLGVTDMVVINLMAPLTHQGYQLYLDNYYTSVPLLLYLSWKGILACGTMRKNRKYFPRDQLSANVKKMKRGEYLWASCKSLNAMVWIDSKPVYFLSSIHDQSLGEPVTRNKKNKEGVYEKVNTTCPQLAIDYNKHMIAVDRSDQNAIVRKDRKQKRYYMRIFIAFLMKSIHNAYIMEGHVKQHVLQGRKKRDMLSFKEELAMQLIGNTRVSGNARGRKRQSGANEMEMRLQNVGIHFPAKGEGKDHTCIVCREKRKQWLRANPDKNPKDCPTPTTKTTFCCTGCEPAKSIYLCIKKDSNCFIDYHTKVQYWR